MFQIKAVFLATGFFMFAVWGMNVDNNLLSITDFGAVPNDGKDDSVAIQKCVDTAAKAGKACFIPEGKYDLSNHLWLGTNATLFGAGEKSVLEFSAGCIRALKNGNKQFYYTGNYNNERIAGKRKLGTLTKAVEKGQRTFFVKTKDEFKAGDWIFINNNRKDTWTILEKQSKGRDTAAYLNGRKDVLAKGQIAEIVSVTGNQITMDRELDAGYEAGSVIGNHVGARNICVRDLAILNNSDANRAYAMEFEQPFGFVLKNLAIKTTMGAGGIRLVHYAFRCLVENCTITNSGKYAVSIANFCSENKVLNNDVTFVIGGDCAILVMMYSKQNWIVNNTVNCLSMLNNNEGGIYIHATSFENKVLHNTIKGASAAIGAYYGANNNLFKGNTAVNSNTGISLWYAGANNLFEDNKFSFGKTRRPGKYAGIRSYCSQSTQLDRNVFSGELDFGCVVTPEKKYSFQKLGTQKYLFSGMGLEFKSDICLNGNHFRSTKPSFNELNK